MRDEFQFHRCRNRLKHYTFVTEPHRLVDPVSSGVCVHTESYRSGSSKAIMGGCLIEYTPQSKWGQRAMGEQPVVACRTWKRVRNLCIPLPEYHHHSKGKSHGVSHERRCFYSIPYHTGRDVKPKSWLLNQ